MSSTATHLVEEVIPQVPVRQLAPWTARSRAMQEQLPRVLSLPIPLRYLLASHPHLLSPVLEVVNRAISGLLIKKSGLKRTQAQAGGVTFIQRFGSALNLNIHFHCLVLDGLYHRSGEEVVFRRVSAPTQAELGQVMDRIVKRLLKLLTRRGYLVEEQGQTYLEGEREESALSSLQSAATSYRIGLGPAIANDRLKLTDCGQVVLQLKNAFRDGTTHIVMSPLELLQKLAALIPRPRLNLIRLTNRMF